MKTGNDQLTEFVRCHGGFVKIADLIKAGFYKAVIRDAIDAKGIERISRGIYSLADGVNVSNPDLVAVSVMVPHGVICLITALSFYEVTDEIPHVIDVAIPSGARAKKAYTHPVKFYYFSCKTWEAGIEVHDIDGHKVRIYSLAKTLADCFKFRHQIGEDVARAALKNALSQKKVSHQDILKYATICRVKNIIKPVLEALI